MVFGIPVLPVRFLYLEVVPVFFGVTACSVYLLRGE
jgi:hypothetical protein